MSDEIAYFERRYYGLALGSPYERVAPAVRALGEHLDNTNEILRSKPPTTRSEFLSERRYSHSAKRQKQQKRSKDRWGYRLYLVQLPGCVLVASPYRSVLTEISNLLQDPDQPAISFLEFDMNALYEDVGGSSDLRARSVTVKLGKESDIEELTMSGKNPLASKVRETIDKMRMTPYSARLMIRDDTRSPAVAVDAFGNIDWHVAAEERVSEGAQVLKKLLETEQCFNFGYENPTRRSTGP